MKILYIDTSVKDLVVVRVEVGEKKHEVSANQKFGSQVLLGLVREVLQKAGILEEELGEVRVNTGPGSFTGLRVGVAVANALAFSLGIPVNGKKIETELVYQ